MKERPILFNSEMVRAILAGTKTQTRRVVKPQPPHEATGFQRQSMGSYWWVKPDEASSTDRVIAYESVSDRFTCPYGQRGDRLWVRETWAIVPRNAYRCSAGVQQTLRPDDDHDAAIYRAGFDRSSGGIRWRPSIHMPRWASRITLEITEVRVERLQDISEADAIAEGIEREPGTAHWKQYDKTPGGWRYWESPIQSYRTLWESINGPGSWCANPWVWCISFSRVTA